MKHPLPDHWEKGAFYVRTDEDPTPAQTTAILNLRREIDREIGGARAELMWSYIRRGSKVARDCYDNEYLRREPTQ